MKPFFLKISCALTLLAYILPIQAEPLGKLLPFGEDGKFKMLYDRRSRSQSLLMGNALFIVYNGDAILEADQSAKKAEARPMLIRYDLKRGTYSEAQPMGPRDNDHHYSPILWADGQDRFHVIHGCHKTPATHLVASQEYVMAGKSSWKKTRIDQPISYPSVYRMKDDGLVLYYRHEGHRGAWTYMVSKDHGKSWQRPANFVTDLNDGDDLRDIPLVEMDEMSSYQCVLPDPNGESLHVVFCHYDDNKDNTPEKFWNPRYKTKKNLGLKFNLYYVKINVFTQEVTNFAGKTLKTPIDLASAKRDCLIWDTDHRGAGVPPDIQLDAQGQPTFLHVLTEETPETLNYYYVRYEAGQWRQTVIAPSNHEWNSGHLSRDQDGNLVAYLVVGEGYLDGGFNDKHGGGMIEKWMSRDQGRTWGRVNTLIPRQYEGWRFNNVQSVRAASGEIVPGMLLFYGWKDGNRPKGKGFLWVAE